MNHKNWKSFQSDNLFQRLGLEEREIITLEEVELNYHTLFQWWNRRKNEAEKFRKVSQQALDNIKEAYEQLDTEKKIEVYQKVLREGVARSGKNGKNNAVSFQHSFKKERLLAHEADENL